MTPQPLINYLFSTYSIFSLEPQNFVRTKNVLISITELWWVPIGEKKFVKNNCKVASIVLMFDRFVNP